MAVLAPPVVLFVERRETVAVLELPLLFKNQGGSSHSVFCVPLVLSTTRRRRPRYWNRVV